VCGKTAFLYFQRRINEWDDGFRSFIKRDRAVVIQAVCKGSRAGLQLSRDYWYLEMCGGRPSQPL